MICPTCKTELVEVNGRFICSDCGREIPENEVMASDWGNGSTARAGLYGAGTDETPVEGSKSITDYEASLTDMENEEIPQASAPDPESPAEGQAPREEPTTTPEVSSDTGFYTPEQIPETNSSTPEAPAVMAADPVETLETPIVPPVQEETSVVPEIPVVLTTEMPVMTPEDIVSVPETVVPEAQEIPITRPEDVVPPTSEAEPPIKDMFESTEPVLPPQPIDPAIYTDPMYENAPESASPQPQATPPAAAVTVSAEKRTNMIILISGVALVLMLVGGGIWGYFSLNKPAQPIGPAPVAEEDSWQELQVVDGGFKIKFPGKPEQQEGSQSINGVESTTTSNMYTTEDEAYMTVYATMDSAQAAAIAGSPTTMLPKLVDELAKTNPSVYTVSETRIGKYYNADAMDFTFSAEEASYRGKIIVKGTTYIVIMAGSDSGQAVEYDKFIKSFGFIVPGSNE